MNELALKRDFRNLLIIAGLYSLGIALSNTFVNIFIWKQFNDLIVLGYYNAIVFFVQIISTIVAGRLANLIDRVFVLRIGLIFYLSFYCAVLFTRDWPEEKIILLGALLGVAAGCYWLSFHLLNFEITSPENRDSFNGLIGMLSSFGTLIGPISASFIIHSLGDRGYMTVFMLSMVLLIIASIISAFLHRRKRKNTFNLKIAKHIAKEHKNYRSITYAHFFQGLREGVFAFTITTYIFMITDNELAIGKYMLIHSIISIVVYYLVSKFLPTNYRKKSIEISGFFLFISLFLLVGEISYINFIIYAIIIAIMFPLLLVPFQSMSYDIIGQLPNLDNYRLEYIVWKELFLSGGRLIAVIFYIIILFIFPIKWGLSIILLVIGSGHSMIYFVIRKI